MLMNNQNKSLENKKDLMDLQLLKSEIRNIAKQTSALNYINIHSEKIVYDFENKPQTIEDLFHNIIDSIELDDAYKYNNIMKSQKQNELISIQQQTEKEEEKEQEKERDKEIRSHDCYLYYHNENYLEVQKLQLDENLYVYANLEVMFNGYNLIYNTSGMIFVKENDNLIIAPFYYLTLYNENTEIFNHKFVNIRTNKKDKALESKFKEYTLFKLLNGNIKQITDVEIEEMLETFLVYRFYIYNNYYFTKTGDFSLIEQIETLIEKMNISEYIKNKYFF